MIQVFSKQWFKKYNKWITIVARLPILGELIFSFKKFGHYVDRNRIVEVTPNSVIESLGGFEYKQHFFVRNEYALRLQHVFYPIWITFHIWDIITRPIPQLNLGFDTLTEYPQAGAGGANVTCDGLLFRTVSEESFSNIRTGAGNGAVYDGINALLRITAGTTSNLYTSLRRIGLGFNTSSLTSGATISGATFSIIGIDKNNNLGSFDVHLAGFNPTTVNTLENADYLRVYTTSFGSVAYADLVVDSATYNIITLNAGGISSISKTGVSTFSIQLGWDILNDTTGLTWSSGANSTTRLSLSDDATIAKPKLVVTYTTVVGPANLKSYNTNLAANIKTINTNAIANVKSLDTNV